MLSWPDKAKKAMSVFFVKWNDLDVYVEDTAKHATTFYVALINNALKGKCKVSNVFPLGDRTSVIETCRNERVGGQRSRVYLVDGDLDLVAGITIATLPHLYCHKVYAVESYLFCEQALIDLLHEENPNYSLEQIKDIFDFSNFQAELSLLVDLFLVFGLTRAIDPSLPTISLGLGAFLNQEKTNLDTVKITNFCVDRKSELLARVSEAELNTEESNIRIRLAGLRSEIDIVAAREFLFPLFQIRRQGKGLKLVAKKDTMQIRLAKTVDLSPHKSLLSALQKIATTW